MKLHPRVTPDGLALARSRQRLRRHAESVEGGGWVVGYGHTASARAGAEVDAADADVLLLYDLSRAAGEVEAALKQPVTTPVFEALAVLAFEVGPDDFARSPILTRLTLGQRVEAAEVLGPSADRVTAGRDHAPGRNPPHPTAAAFDPEATQRLSPFDHPDGSPWDAPLPRAPSSLHNPGVPVATPRADEPISSPYAVSAPDGAPSMGPEVADRRARWVSHVWRRFQADPRVYAALGVCGAVLFAAAVAGFFAARPSGLGLAVGFTGVLCMAVAVGFFLYRRRG